MSKVTNKKYSVNMLYEGEYIFIYADGILGDFNEVVFIEDIATAKKLYNSDWDYPVQLREYGYTVLESK